MTIGFWGDSIIYGACDTEALGWVGRVRKSLPTDDCHHIYNFGICGDTTEDLLKRFDVEVDAVKPGQIIFAVGINDSKFPEGSGAHKVSLSDYKQNLEQLLTKAKNYTENIIIIGATKVDDELRSAHGSQSVNKEIQKFNIVMKALSDKHGYKYIDVFNVLDPAVDLADGLHPNTQGYEKMFNFINPQLQLNN